MIVVAAGSSVRFGGDKLLAMVAGRPLVAHTVAAVIEHVDHCVLVCRQDQMASLDGLGAELVPGGPTRTASEMAGLSALGGQAGLIGIHDGARPLVQGSLIETLFRVADRVGGAIPILEPEMPLIHKSDLSPAASAVVAQTPQVFRGEELLAAYTAATRVEYQAQDTAEVVQKFGRLVIEGVPGDPANIKVTEPADIEVVRAALEPSRNEPR